MNTPKPYIFTDDNKFTVDDYARSINRLKRPEGRVDVLLDTDMFNEVDDQFALAYLLQSEDKISLKALCAAPFHNHHSTGPGNGMEESYNEIFKVLKLIKREEFSDQVYKGSDQFLKSEDQPIDSPAVQKIIELSKQYDEENPLFILSIAAATNIASALKLCPEIKDRIFVIWVGGMGFDWHDNKSFNAGQDIAAARVVLSSGAPVVILPGRGVLDRLTTTGPELEYWLKDKNEFCNYIIEKTERESTLCNGEKCWSRPLSDIAAVAWLIGENFMLDRLEHSPVMEYDHLYAKDHRRLFVRYVYSINRDKIMGDLFSKLIRYR